MKGTPLSDYYWLGVSVSYLLSADHTCLVHGEGGILDNVDSFLSDLHRFGLVVTHEVAVKQGLVRLYNELRLLGKKAVLPQERVEQLRALMETVCVTLEAEIAGFEAFTVSPKRLDVTLLKENVSALFAPGVYNQLAETARYDLAEAGKCIAFELPTAAAFHLFRGTTDVLRHFYCALVRHKRVKTLAWTPMLNDLRKRPATRKHELLYNHLDALRASFKDPAQDPEVVYDVDQAQDLWLACAQAVNRMTKILYPSLQ